jgi:hypothetical protein
VVGRLDQLRYATRNRVIARVANDIKFGEFWGSARGRRGLRDRRTLARDGRHEAPSPLLGTYRIERRPSDRRNRPEQREATMEYVFVVLSMFVLSLLAQYLIIKHAVKTALQLFILRLNKPKTIADEAVVNALPQIVRALVRESSSSR